MITTMRVSVHMLAVVVIIGIAGSSFLFTWMTKEAVLIHDHHIHPNKNHVIRFYLNGAHRRKTNCTTTACHYNSILEDYEGRNNNNKKNNPYGTYIDDNRKYSPREQVTVCGKEKEEERGKFSFLFPAWLLFVGSMLSSPQRKDDEWVNGITSPPFIDASCIYGRVGSFRMRTLKCGKLKTDAIDDGEFLHTDPSTGEFMSASDLTTWHAGVLALHTLFVREHNRLASVHCEKNPLLSDKEIFDLARMAVISEIQSITFREVLPLLLQEEEEKDGYITEPCYDPRIDSRFVPIEFAFGALPAALCMMMPSSSSLKKNDLLNQKPLSNAVSPSLSEFLLDARKTACILEDADGENAKNRHLKHIPMMNYTAVRDIALLDTSMCPDYENMELMDGLLHDKCCGKKVLFNLFADQLLRSRDSDKYYSCYHTDTHHRHHGKLYDVITRNTHIHKRHLLPPGSKSVFLL